MKNPYLRPILMAISFIGGLFCVIFGWTMTGKLSGLGIMVLGVFLILIALFLYNLPYSKLYEKFSK